MKRFISILVAVMMVLTLLPVGRVFAEEEEVTKQEEMRGPSVDPTTIEEKFEANKMALKAKIDEAQEIDLSKYADGDVKNNFTKAIEEAETVYALTEVTEENVGKMQEATTKLTEAINTFRENATPIVEPNPEDALNKAKETAKIQIDSLEYLSGTERDSYKTEIDNANSDAEINAILEKAETKNT
ncbi:MAG: GA module-containing protein, partial [Eubacteriales bacterium]|nr:GA module-containing protein [Eubacteriales bacterium]